MSKPRWGWMKRGWALGLVLDDEGGILSLFRFEVEWYWRVSRVPGSEGGAMPDLRIPRG